MTVNLWPLPGSHVDLPGPFLLALPISIIVTVSYLLQSLTKSSVSDNDVHRYLGVGVAGFVLAVSAALSSSTIGQSSNESKALGDVRSLIIQPPRTLRS